MTISTIISICIIAVAIVFQIIVFIYLIKKMIDYAKVFNEEDTYVVDGFLNYKSERNPIFKNIVDSINRLLRKNKGSVIDFSLIKDNVEKPMEVLSDEIDSQVPVPLYCGLAGTMATIILGLGLFVYKGSITSLMTSGGGDGMELAMHNASQGIKGLLIDVAIAMGSSALGLVLTIISTYLLKGFRLKAEQGKNNFLIKLQSQLLPELPSSTSDVMQDMVRGLNAFNKEFKANTKDFYNILSVVESTYKQNAQLLSDIKDMDFRAMSNANVKVLKELQNSTEKLEYFNQYLSEVEGYTTSIQAFNEQFAKEAERTHVLEEIRDFFKTETTSLRERRGLMNKIVAEYDGHLQDTFKDINKSAQEGMNNVAATLDQYSNSIKESIEENKRIYKEAANELQKSFEEQLKTIPSIAKKLEDVSKIPHSLELLADRIDKSNKELINRVISNIQNNNSTNTYQENNSKSFKLSKPMKWLIYVCLASVSFVSVLQLVDFLLSRLFNINI